MEVDNAKSAMSLDDVVIEEAHEEEVNPNDVAKWKHGLFSCFEYGYCNPLVCLACWCLPSTCSGLKE